MHNTYMYACINQYDRHLRLLLAYTSSLYVDSPRVPLFVFTRIQFLWYKQQQMD